MQFEWLTIEWLMRNLDWIAVVLVLGMLVLFFFPVLLGYDLKEKADKMKRKND